MSRDYSFRPAGIRFLSLSFLLVLLGTSAARSQGSVQITIDPGNVVDTISPLIYGINWVHGGEAVHPDWNLGSRRLGGNRLSNYNWENNYSNSGADCDASCQNENDDWLTYLLPEFYRSIPAGLPISFHYDSRSTGAFSIVQLQGAGYVAADVNAEVRPVPPAPNSRWKKVEYMLPTPFTTTPDVNDGTVYMNQQVARLVELFGNAKNGGVQGYSLDNEPGLWISSHPRLRGLNYNGGGDVSAADDNNSDPAVENAKVTGIGLVQMNSQLAAAVKSVDPDAKVFGPEFWGFLGYYNLQNANDWETLAQQYDIYADAYLAMMKQASDVAGTRLLDVFSFHWYPQVNETPDEILQAPRSLWDPTYKENSWIARDVLNGPIAVIPTLRASIAAHYPGTELAITEFRYGDVNNGDTWYGGLALADALGIFGKEGVYAANYHPVDLDAELGGYVEGAYKLYRNYDGEKGTFGNRSVQQSSSDLSVPSYAALDSLGRLHLIVINKTTQGKNLNITLSGGNRSYQSADIYGFDASSSQVRPMGSVALIENNVFTSVISPRTALHFVIRPSQSSVDGGSGNRTSGTITISADPSVVRHELHLSFGLKQEGAVSVELINEQGAIVNVLIDRVYGSGEHSAVCSLANVSPGSYFCRIVQGEEVGSCRVIVAK